MSPARVVQKGSAGTGAPLEQPWLVSECDDADYDEVGDGNDHEYAEPTRLVAGLRYLPHYEDGEDDVRNGEEEEEDPPPRLARYLAGDCSTYYAAVLS